MRHNEKMALIDKQIKDMETDVRALELQLENLRGELKGLYTAKSLYNGKPLPTPEARKRIPIKTCVLDILGQRAAAGADVHIILDIAEKEKGIKLKRNSVSSLLSRLTAEGALVYDQSVYRIKEFSTEKSKPISFDPKSAARVRTRAPDQVVPLRTLD